ncbi:MAG: [protein-PII] uridylyltransferase [Verrucomicrobiae bacterium]|nr:[protein-PII] uridylyltransferase [Verrucomicrobiae bacterium]
MAITYLEKVLRHAEERLISSPKSRPADILALYQKFIRMEEHRLRIQHRGGAGGREICRGRATLIDVMLRHIHRGAEEFLTDKHGARPHPRLSLLAVGGYGRGELNPFSDVDILFLYEGRSPKPEAFTDEMVQQILYMLWDIGLKVGHASRCIPDTLAHANQDMQSMTAMMEARFLTGNTALFAEFQEQFRLKCLKPHVDDYIRWRMNDQTDRHAKAGNTVFIQEPNIKNGCGGLRDYQNLHWIARVKKGVETTPELESKGLITRSELKQLEAAYDFLMRVRNELHYRAGRPNDTINLNLQGKIADAFGYQQRTVLRRIEVFMKEYYTHARNIFFITNLAAEKLSLSPERQTITAFNFLARLQKKQETIDGFVFRNGIIHAENSSVFREDSFRLIRVFLYQQQRQASLDPELRSLIQSRLGLVDRSFCYSKSARETFRAILESKGQVGRILRSMHEVGFLGRYLPEFGRLTCLVQHEFFHRYTADEHTLQCIEKLDMVLDSKEPLFAKYTPLFQKLENPFVLYLALILHDTGRAENSRHHSDSSAKNAMHIAKRFHLTEEERRQLIMLVDHHLTMSEFGRKRDLCDPAVIREFAQIVRDERGLDKLHLMTFADSQGVGSNTGSDWRELSHWQLYHSTREFLAGSFEQNTHTEDARGALREEVTRLLRPRGEDLADQIDEHFLSMPPRYFLIRSPEQVADDIRLVGKFLHTLGEDTVNALAPVSDWRHYPEAGNSRVTVCTWDRENLFLKIAGAFTVADLNILNAAIYTRRDNIILDTFRVCDTKFAAVTDERDIRLVENTLHRALTDPDFDLVEKIESLRAKRPRPEPLPERFPQRIIVDNHVSAEATMIEIQTADRMGLLFDVLEVFSRLNVDIFLAKISTEKGAALDTFYVTDRTGGKIMDPHYIESIRTGLRRKI